MTHHRTYSDPADLIAERKAKGTNGWPIRRADEQPSAKVVPMPKRKSK